MRGGKPTVPLPLIRMSAHLISSEALLEPVVGLLLEVLQIDAGTQHEEHMPMDTEDAMTPPKGARRVEGERPPHHGAGEPSLCCPVRQSGFRNSARLAVSGVMRFHPGMRKNLVSWALRVELHYFVKW